MNSILYGGKMKHFPVDKIAKKQSFRVRIIIFRLFFGDFAYWVMKMRPYCFVKVLLFSCGNWRDSFGRFLFTTCFSEFLACHSVMKIMHQYLNFQHLKFHSVCTAIKTFQMPAQLCVI